MKDQHTLIDGYRDLNQNEINTMNRCKAAGNDLKELIADLKQNPETDQRWVAIAETHLQQGIMAAVRCVAKPGGF